MCLSAERVGMAEEGSSMAITTSTCQMLHKFIGWVKPKSHLELQVLANCAFVAFKALQYRKMYQEEGGMDVECLSIISTTEQFQFIQSWIPATKRNKWRVPTSYPWLWLLSFPVRKGSKCRSWWWVFRYMKKSEDSLIPQRKIQTQWVS